MLDFKFEELFNPNFDAPNDNERNQELEEEQSFKSGLEALCDDNQDKREEAIGYFKKDKSPLSSYMLGHMHESRSKFESAFEAYKEAVNLDPKFEAAWFALARCYKFGLGTAKNEEMAEKSALMQPYITHALTYSAYIQKLEKKKLLKDPNPKQKETFPKDPKPNPGKCAVS